MKTSTLIIVAVVLWAVIILGYAYYTSQQNLFESGVEGFRFIGANITGVEVTGVQSGGANVTFTIELSYDNPTDSSFSLQLMTARADLGMLYDTPNGTKSLLKKMYTLDPIVQVTRHSQGMMTITLCANLTEDEVEIILPFSEMPQFVDATLQPPLLNVPYVDELSLFCFLRSRDNFLANNFRSYDLYTDY